MPLWWNIGLNNIINQHSKPWTVINRSNQNHRSIPAGATVSFNGDIVPELAFDEQIPTTAFEFFSDSVTPGVGQSEFFMFVFPPGNRDVRFTPSSNPHVDLVGQTGGMKEPSYFDLTIRANGTASAKKTS